MLIVAIPKSASTSLMATLGTVYHQPATQEFFADQTIPEGYSVVSRYHSDMRLINEEQASRWCSAGTIYKQHVLPVDHNLQLLRPHRIVLLLRDPEEIVLAYRRAELAKLHPIRPEFQGCVTESAWLEQSERCGLLQELKDWTRNWLDSDVEKLVIQFADVTNRPEGTIAKISKFWDLPAIATPVKLASERFSRAPAARQPRGARGRVAHFLRTVRKIAGL